MEKEELDRYKIRDYYMIPNEIIDNIFYEFETQLKKQKEIIDKTINDINITIEIIKQQPTGNDSWIIDRLNGLKIVLEDKEV